MKPTIDAARKVREKIWHDALSQREEIIKAFVCKYGLQPDECEQIVKEDGTWCIVKINDPEFIKTVQRNVIMARFAVKKFSWWQRFCLWMAKL